MNEGVVSGDLVVLVELVVADTEQGMMNQHPDSGTPRFNSPGAGFHRNVAASGKIQKRSSHKSTRSQNERPNCSENVLERKKDDNRERYHRTPGMGEKDAADNCGGGEENEERIAKLAFFAPI